jgi:hypothetical protein
VTFPFYFVAAGDDENEVNLQAPDKWFLVALLTCADGAPFPNIRDPKELDRLAETKISSKQHLILLVR